MKDNEIFHGKQAEQRKRLSQKTKKTLQCYGILSTQLIGLVVFTLYPIAWAAQKAFYYYYGVPSDMRFVGMQNFIRAFTDEAYWQSWLVTIVFTIGKLPLELPLSMLLALALSRKIKGAGFFRAMYYLPSVISVVVVGLTFTSLFDYFGFINAWLTKFGIIEKNIDWFSETSTAMLVLLIGSVWNTFGVNVLYFMAALSNVPKELYESAKIDGAGSWVTFWKITVPMMGPVLQVILLLAINGTLHTGDYILATTNGAPYSSTYTVIAFQTGKFLPGFGETGVINIGYGCAISIITSIIMVIVALVYSKLSKRLQNIY